MTSIDELESWMGVREGEGLEFKEAKHQFNLEKLVDYCVAIANERGGRIILGVSDKMPRRVVGTAASRPSVPSKSTRCTIRAAACSSFASLLVRWERRCITTAVI